MGVYGSRGVEDEIAQVIGAQNVDHRAPAHTNSSPGICRSCQDQAHRASGREAGAIEYLRGLSQL